MKAQTTITLNPVNSLALGLAVHQLQKVEGVRFESKPNGKGECTIVLASKHGDAVQMEITEDKIVITDLSGLMDNFNGMMSEMDPANLGDLVTGFLDGLTGNEDGQVPPLGEPQLTMVRVMENGDVVEVTPDPAFAEAFAGMIYDPASGTRLGNIHDENKVIPDVDLERRPLIGMTTARAQLLSGHVQQRPVEPAGDEAVAGEEEATTASFPEDLDMGPAEGLDEVVFTFTSEMVLMEHAMAVYSQLKAPAKRAVERVFSHQSRNPKQGTITMEQLVAHGGVQDLLDVMGSILANEDQSVARLAKICPKAYDGEVKVAKYIKAIEHSPRTFCAGFFLGYFGALAAGVVAMRILRK